MPLTGSLHRGLYPGQFDILLNGRRSRVLCDQVRVVDQSALNVPHAHISRDVEATLENALLEVLGIREMAGVSLA